MKPFEECYAEARGLFDKTSPIFDDVEPFVTMIVLAHLYAAWMMTQDEDKLERAVEIFNLCANETYDAMCDALEAERMLQ
jgi:hypothetical protein